MLAAAVLLAGCAPAPSVSTDVGIEREASEQNGVEIALVDGWTKSADSGGMTGLFGTLMNDGSDDLVIESVESDAAEFIELHEVTTDGIMQEIPGDVLIPSSGSYELAPGADHIMLMNLTRDLLAGDEVTVTVHFTDGSSQSFTVLVKDYSGANEDYGDLDHEGHEGHDHSGGGHAEEHEH